jgi:TPR repeat protein
MTKLVARLLVVVVALMTIGVGLFILRNDQMDRGVHALKKENGVAALARLKPLAQLGDKTAQFLVGSIYAYGSGGIPKSDEDAIYWFRRLGSFGPVVVEKGVDPAAPYALTVAKAYARGTGGVEADPAESLKWLKLAAEGGSKEAVDMLTQSLIAPNEATPATNPAGTSRR